MTEFQKDKNELPESVRNYLQKYGLNGWKTEHPAGKKYNNIVIIPAIQEYENIRRLLNSLGSNDNKYFDESLFLFVINNLPSAAPDVKADNLESLIFLRSFIDRDDKMNIGVIDAASGRLELPENKGGVGMARKIGADLALKLFDYNNNKKKILLSLDADCTVEPNYLTAIVDNFNRKNISAAYVQYEHKIPAGEQEARAIICYEIFLRYYALGLKYANSKYAFPTIGSTIICEYESYIKAGGMNTKKAAEDFYFLEKLAKVSNVEKIDDTKVYPSSRSSWRVPFGTGQRVNRFHNGTHNEYVLYDPESFEILRKWLEIFNSHKTLTTEEYINAAQIISPALKEFLIMNEFETSWNKILQHSKTEAQIQKQKNVWFDGFRTLKLIHFLRDNGSPQINMFKAVEKLVRFEKNLSASMLKMEERIDIPPVEIQTEYLYLLRKLT